MNSDERNLSELDIKHISSTLGRTPSETEISFIELILLKELKTREYLQILKRLDDGAKREINNRIELDEKTNLFVHNGLKIINQNNSLLLNKDETQYINKINNIVSIIDDIVINSPTNQNVDKIIKKEVTNRKNKSVIGGRFLKNNEKEIRYFTSIGMARGDNSKIHLNRTNSHVYKINFGKRTFQKNINQLTKFIDEIKSETWLLFVKTINWNGLGASLIDMCRKLEHGISINNDLSSETLNLHFSDDNTLSILVITQQEYFPQLNVFCKKYNLSCDEIGIIINDPIIQIKTKNESLINLPVSVFDLQYNVNTKHFIPSEIDIETSSTISKKYGKTSYTSQLLKLLPNIFEDDIVWNKPARKGKLIKNCASYGLYSDVHLVDNHIVFAQSDNNNLIDTSSRLSGRVSVASAVRKLSCTGAKPIAVIIHNLFPNPDKNILWKASELLQGQEEAVRELEVEIGNRSIDIFENYWHQNISAIGIQPQKTLRMDTSFKDNDDFISLLGSHRGELSGSAHEQYIVNKKSDVLPTVDLKMEKRLQDVIRQGIETNLIKSATNVSTGGISIAVARSLIASDGTIGARIHLSRKLNEEELLFGETQGLVVVTLGEDDIMEFERICMTIGVPSTTIGRVTDNELFTFNELIKVKVDKLRSIL